VRTASRRARRLGGLLLLAATVWWAFMRRRANAVRWVEPPATTLPTGGAPTRAVPAEPGPPGDLPDDVLATDAGLTELPDQAVDDALTGAVDDALTGTVDDALTGTVDDAPAGTVDEARVAEILAESADADVVVVDETTYEQALADAAPEPSPAAEADVEVVAAGPEVAEPDEESTEARLDAGEPSGAVDEEPTERELVAPGVEESAESIQPEAAEESARGIPMPTFSEAPTAEIPAVTDDLRAVRGIGPSMERKLHELGIVSYRQLAMLDGAELERLRAELTDFRGRIEREDWVGQARALYREKYGRDPA
jgi:predicted flap endonuclease-1-like 5' DNA nuclease